MSFSISEHPEWYILDSSKLTDYITCPRQFFYRHILGWRTDTPAHDLHFGTSWHKAREWQLLHGYEDIQGSYLAFIDEYRKVFSQDTDSFYTPKNPAAVLSALIKFNDEHKDDLRENDLVEVDGVKMTEISGTVPIDDKRFLYYKMDSILRRKENGMIFSWDHKTTSGKWIHDTRWDNELYLSVQNGTYNHCLYCMFPIEQVLGVTFCKTGFEFLERSSKNRSAGYHSTTRYVPAFKTPEQMNTWLWNTNDIVDNIERDLDRLSHCREDDTVMMAFQQNPKSCTAYGGCPFLDFCLAWQNPLQRCDKPPLGFVQEFWDPTKMDTTVKKNLNWRG